MTFESAPSPHLSKLAELLEGHSTATGEAATALALITEGKIAELKLTNENGEAINSATLAENLTAEIKRLIDEHSIPAECDLRLQSVAAEAPSSHNPVQAASSDPGDLETATQVNNDGLLLRSALLKLGHGEGYSTAEIDKAAKNHGKTVPELRFYRSAVREGKVAEGQHGDIFSSDIDSDFGASELSTDEATLPAVTTSDVVQPLLSHHQWVEIAHDSQNLYAVDLAPGTHGEVGQIIGRVQGETKPPFIVARSLTQFITGDWISENDPVTETNTSSDAPVSTVHWQVISSVLEPSTETASVFETEDTSVSAAEAYAASDVTVENGEIIEPESEPESQDTGLTYIDFEAVAAEEASQQEPHDEEDIVDLRSTLETHNADKLNKTERELADDFAAIAFGAGKRREAPVSDDEPEDSSEEPAHEERVEEPLTRREVSEKAHEGTFKAALKKFFLG